MDNATIRSAAVAAAVESAMQAAGESRLGLATKTGIPYSTLTRRLTRATSSLTIAEISLIDAALGVDILAAAYLTESVS